VVLLTFFGALAAGEMQTLAEAFGALVVLLFPAALAASLRFRDRALRRDIEHAQLRERQLLARELHDTVAHHLSAILIQAQAAKAVAARRPEAMREALDTVEVESARALAELRSLVGALREDEDAARTPRAKAAAIEALAREAGEHVSFVREGQSVELAPAVDLALHRIARESLHNAARHADGATRVEIKLATDGDLVRLTIRDDGRASRGSGGRGFGIVGMRERAALLGGTLEAGPLPEGGFCVEAVLPAAGSRS
jgi:signal transduction histidine kinase